MKTPINCRTYIFHWVIIYMQNIIVNYGPAIYIHYDIRYFLLSQTSQLAQLNQVSHLAYLAYWKVPEKRLSPIGFPNKSCQTDQLSYLLTNQFSNSLTFSVGSFKLFSLFCSTSLFFIILSLKQKCELWPSKKNIISKLYDMNSAQRKVKDLVKITILINSNSKDYLQVEYLTKV